MGRFLLILATIPIFAATPAQLRDQIRSALRVPNPLPALNPEHYGDLRITPDVIIERVSYSTAYGLRVPAIVYYPSPRPAGRMPGLVVVNGHGGDKFSWYSVYAGILYARAGAFVLTYDPIGEGERNAERKSDTRQHDQTIDPPEMGRRMGGLMMTDVLQAVSYLAQRRDVDPTRIGALGFSMGSFVLGLACAVETRLNSCVLSSGGNLDDEGGYWDTSAKKMCQAIPYQSMRFLGDRGAVLYFLHADRGATFVLNGTADNMFAASHTNANFFEDLRKRTLTLHPPAANVFEFAWVEGGGHQPYFLTRTAALWLEKHLEFPRWSPEKIAQMPETPLEGGLRALGEGLPSVARELLHVLPDDRWENEKAAYVYETWVQRAAKLLP